MTRTGLKGRRAEAVLFSFEGADLQYNKICGDYSGEVTPVPIPNTEVKLLCADDTWWETAWESRTLPLILVLWSSG